MSENNCQAVIDLACSIFGGSDPEALTILMHKLASEERMFGGRVLNWQTLADFVNQKQSFKSHANSLIKDSRRNDSEAILDAAVEIEKKMHQNCSTEFGAIDFFDRNPNLISSDLFCGQIELWNDLPQSGKLAILKFISNCVQNISVLHSIGKNENFNLIILRTSIYAKSVSITLATLPIPHEILRAAYLWWYEKLHGKLAASKVVNSTISVIPRFGKAFNEVGKVVCELGTSKTTAISAARRMTICGGQNQNRNIATESDLDTVANKLFIEILYEQIFVLQKPESQGLAYKYLNIRSGASDADVAEAYRRHLLIDHPDKGGNKEAFCKLQAFMAIICIARGEIVVT
uniref:J domain-containing protein n=1 Tax=Panagrolaimus sp. ES5 TaxID=591445 RepID=A0AC34FWE9_9BILA